MAIPLTLSPLVAEFVSTPILAAPLSTAIFIAVFPATTDIEVIGLTGCEFSGVIAIDLDLLLLLLTVVSFFTTLIWTVLSEILAKAPLTWLMPAIAAPTSALI